MAVPRRPHLSPTFSLMIGTRRGRTTDACTHLQIGFVLTILLAIGEIDPIPMRV
jgi:hypothetical protein